MGSLYLPIRRGWHGRKPAESLGINRANPLSRGLVSCLLFQDYRDETGLLNFTEMTTPYRLHGDAHLQAGMLHTDGGNDCIELGNTPVHSGDISIVVIGTPHTVSGDQSILTADSFSSGKREWQFRLSGGKVNFVPFVSNSNGNITGATTVSAGRKYVFGASHNSTLTSNNAAVYLDGVQDGIGTKAGALDADGAALVVGAGGSTAPLSSPSQIYNDFNASWNLVLIWNRDIGAVGHKAIARQPLQVLSRSLAWYLIGGGGTAIVVQDLSQSQSLDNVTLTQAHTLAVADIDQAQSLDNVTLTQAHVIAPADVAQAQLIDAATLTQAHVLSVADLEQAQSIDNVTLTVAGALALQDIAQAQGIDTATLIQNYVLVVQDLAQAQSIDNVTLTPAGFVVAPDDIAQDQAIENTTLTQYGVLAVNDLTQQQIIDIVSLGGLVVGELEGTVVIYALMDGQIEMKELLTGSVVLH